MVYSINLYFMDLIEFKFDTVTYFKCGFTSESALQIKRVGDTLIGCVVLIFIIIIVNTKMVQVIVKCLKAINRISNVYSNKKWNLFMSIAVKFAILTFIFLTFTLPAFLSTWFVPSYSENEANPELISFGEIFHTVAFFINMAHYASFFLFGIIYDSTAKDFSSFN
jgi:hypothetical protein